MSKHYYAGPGKKPTGPYSTEEMRTLADEGKISDDTFVISEGQTNWVRFADWKAARVTSDAAEAIAQKAQQMGAAIAKFHWGTAIFGLLLVLVEIFILPWRLLSKAARTLSDWGRERMLPTTQSDLPVATFFTIVLRPAIHILFTIIGAIVVCVMSYKLMRGSELRQGSGASGLGMLFGGSICVYFANLIIGAAFDLISQLVIITNSVRNIERK